LQESTTSRRISVGDLLSEWTDSACKLEWLILKEVSAKTRRSTIPYTHEEGAESYTSQA